MSLWFKLVAILVVLGLVSCLPQNRLRTEEQVLADEEAAMMAARNARYSFSTDLDDKISDLTVHRDETRDGLTTRGSYSYSDGFQKRTVKYEADENGYRVISERVQSLNNGPHVDSSGTASVRAHLQDGTDINYKIQSVP